MLQFHLSNSHTYIHFQYLLYHICSFKFPHLAQGGAVLFAQSRAFVSDTKYPPPLYDPFLRISARQYVPPAAPTEPGGYKCLV